MADGRQVEDAAITETIETAILYGPGASTAALARHVCSALTEAGYEIIPAAELKALRDDRNDLARQVFRRTGERDEAMDGISGKDLGDQDG